MRFVFTAACLLGALATQLSAAGIITTIFTFEGIAPPGGTNKSLTYSESGFTLSPSNLQWLVFDSADFYRLPGDTTSWLGFAAGNTITLTGAGVFNLDSAVIGPSTIGSGIVNFTVTGFIHGGGTVSTTFSGLTAAIDEPIGFANLDRAQFVSTSDAGLDDIQLNSPEPASLLLLGAGFAGIAGILRRRCVSQA
jgi:PEP-CTERM motif